MALDYVKKLTGDNPIVDDIYNKVESLLLSRLTDVGAVIVPRELEYIVEEATIVRFNRVGAEGLTSESVSGYSASYTEDGLLQPYGDVINNYISKVNGGRKNGVVYFL